MEIMKLFIAKRVALTAGVLLALAGAAWAQTASDAIVTITSVPPGATVMLTGDLTVAGVTPTKFTQRFAGQYKVKAFCNGYENYNSSVVLAAGQPTDISIQLKPKTRVKAAIRSLIIPGWGQRYYGASTKGALLFVGTAVSGLAAGILHLEFDKDRDDYYAFRDRYEAERLVEERERMLPELNRLQGEADDSERTRNIAAAVVAGFWAYSFLDAIVFFPDYGISVSGAGLSVAPEYDGKEVKLMGRLTF